APARCPRAPPARQGLGRGRCAPSSRRWHARCYKSPRLTRHNEEVRMMNGHRALLGALAGLALALAPACRHTAEGAKEDARENSEKAQTATQKAADETKEAAQKVGEQAKEAAGKVGEGAQEAGAKVKEGAREVVSQLDASKQLVDVKAALMADSGIDASNIRVDTDAD